MEFQQSNGYDPVTTDPKGKIHNKICITRRSQFLKNQMMVIKPNIGNWVKI